MDNPNPNPQPSPSPEPTKTFADFIGEGGKLQEGWQGKFLAEDLRSNPIFNEIKDLPGAFSIIANQAKLVGKKGVIIPTEASGQSEWDAYFEAKGRPTTAEDYVMQIPEGAEDAFDAEEIKEAKQMFHQLGFNQKEVDALWKYEVGRQAKLEQLLKQMEEQDFAEADKALREKWSAAYDENMHLVNRMISENAAEGEEKDFLLAEYGNNPRLANFLCNIAKKFVSHRIITDVETPSAVADGKIKEIMGVDLDPAARAKLPYWDGSHPEHKNTVAIVKRLFEEQSKRKQAVGATA